MLLSTKFQYLRYGRLPTDAELSWGSLELCDRSRVRIILRIPNCPPIRQAAHYAISGRLSSTLHIFRWRFAQSKILAACLLTFQLTIPTAAVDKV